MACPQVSKSESWPAPKYLIPGEVGFPQVSNYEKLACSQVSKSEKLVFLLFLESEVGRVLKSETWVVPSQLIHLTVVSETKHTTYKAKFNL